MDSMLPKGGFQINRAMSEAQVTKQVIDKLELLSQIVAQEIADVGVEAETPDNWSEVVDDGGKPDDNADVTASNTAAGILNQGDLAVMNAAGISHTGGTAPSNPKEGWLWHNTSLTPNTIERYNGSGWIIVGTVEASWSGVENDGGKPSNNATDNSGWEAPENSDYIKPGSLLVYALSDFDVPLGNFTAGVLTGITIRTASDGRRIEIMSNGITLYSGSAATGGVCGTTANGGSNEVCGTVANGGSEMVAGVGILARINNTGSGLPFEVLEEQSVADIGYYNRSTDPSGTAKIGHTAVVNAKFKLCTTAGTPGTWTVAGTQT